MVFQYFNMVLYFSIIHFLICDIIIIIYVFHFPLNLKRRSEIMGTTYSAYVSEPDTTPKADAVPTFDPALGFDNGRKERGFIFWPNIYIYNLRNLKTK